MLCIRCGRETVRIMKKFNIKLFCVSLLIVILSCIKEVSSGTNEHETTSQNGLHLPEEVGITPGSQNGLLPSEEVEVTPGVNHMNLVTAPNIQTSTSREMWDTAVTEKTSRSTRRWIYWTVM